jgi:hypothetical protein
MWEFKLILFLAASQIYCLAAIIYNSWAHSQPKTYKYHLYLSITFLIFTILVKFSNHGDCCCYLLPLFLYLFWALKFCNGSEKLKKKRKEKEIDKTINELGKN